ncbi:efflux RND transporter periplasmic adaptor subunit [bacterium]|nr:efflux RND transporter periplasmic adaptor subunit [bacterium]
MNCCGRSKFVKYIWLLIGLIILAVVISSLTSCSKKESAVSSQVSKESIEKEIVHYTCGMHPSVKVSPKEYNRGNVNCPICNMKLIPVYRKDAKDEEEIDKSKDVVSRVKIKGDEIRLAGVKTEPARKLHLYKEIRTVGRVAYDPKLAIAEEEFISSLKALDKIQEGAISEIKERTGNLVESSKRKLKLLGLSQEQINELEKKREVQTSLILPEKKMWIYGDVYEYELSWIKAGQKVEVTTSSFPGKEFDGVISSVNPVLDSKTRSVRFRTQVDNPDLKLKPEMYVDMVIISMYMSPDGEHMVLAIPKDAVLDTGTRKIVWIDKRNGEYEGRIVEIGPEATSKIDGRVTKFYPVLRGLKENELVVTKANFLIDSQSQISGVVAAAYGGAMGMEEKKAPPVHQH